MSQKDTGTTDEDPNDYLDNLDDLYGKWIGALDESPGTDTVMALVALTIEVRKARQALEAIAEHHSPKGLPGETLTKSAARHLARLREDTDWAAARADQIDNERN